MPKLDLKDSVDRSNAVLAPYVAKAAPLLRQVDAQLAPYSRPAIAASKSLADSLRNEPSRVTHIVFGASLWVAIGLLGVGLGVFGILGGVALAALTIWSYGWKGLFNARDRNANIALGVDAAIGGLIAEKIFMALIMGALGLFSLNVGVLIGNLIAAGLILAIFGGTYLAVSQLLIDLKGIRFDKRELD